MDWRLDPSEFVSKCTQARELYSRVVKLFPDIQENEIILDCVNDSSKIISLSIINYHTFWYRNEINIGPILRIGLQFFNLLTEKQREAGIAHELGHYKHVKKSKDVNRMRRLGSLTLKNSIHNARQKPFSIPAHIEDLLNKKYPSIEKIQKYLIMFEVYADNEAANVGYGKEILEQLKSTETPDYLPEFYKQEIAERIKNLEERLNK